MDNGDEHHPIELPDLLQTYVRDPDDQRLIEAALEATVTKVLLKTIDGKGAVGRNFAGDHTLDFSFRQIYFKNVTESDLSWLPEGTQVHPEYG